jgi:hypothetical protein
MIAARPEYLLSGSRRIRMTEVRRCNQIHAGFIPLLADLIRFGDLAHRAVRVKLFPSWCFGGMCGNTVGQTLASRLRAVRPHGLGRVGRPRNLRISGRTLASCRGLSVRYGKSREWTTRGRLCGLRSGLVVRRRAVETFLQVHQSEECSENALLHFVGQRRTDQRDVR